MRTVKSLGLLKRRETVKGIKFAAACLYIIVICIANGLHNLHNANFYPMNGTYQNYNPWRRIMVGEVPFKDFVSLYGLGQIYTGAFLTFLFGGSYATSMVVADFLSLFCTAVLFFTVQYLISRKALRSISITAILTSLIAVVRPSLFSKMPTAVVEMIQLALNNNNARMLRAVVVSVIPLLGMIAVKLWRKRHPNALDEEFDAAFARICGGTAITGILWENCMGVCICAGISFLWFITVIHNYHRKMKYVGYLCFNYCMTGILFFGAILVLLTREGAFHYIRSAFSMGEGFFWYNNNGPMIIHLSDINLNVWVIICFGLMVFSVYKMLKTEDKMIQISSMYASSIFFCAVFANFLYNWSSGGTRRDVLMPAIIGSICALLSEASDWVRNEWGENFPERIYRKACKLCSVGGILIFSSCLAFVVKLDEDAVRITKERGVFFDGLGGYIDVSPRSRWGASAEDVEIGLKTVKGGSLWSTFSTAVDVLTDTYHPSGFDYMEYALGRDQQEHYLTSFRDSKASFVQTMNPEFNPWDVWDKGQNAYFWEELYKGYVPFTRNSTSIYWRKTSKEDMEFQPEIKIDVEKEDTSTVMITASTNVKEPFVAFIEVEYECDKDRHLSTGLLRKMLEIEDVSYRSLHRDIEDMQFGWYLPWAGTRVLPVTVYNGAGSLRLSVYQAKEVSLNVGNILVKASYRTPYQYIFCDDISENGFVHGVSEQASQIIIPNTYCNHVILDSVKCIRTYDGVICQVTQMEEKGNSIYLTLSCDDETLTRLHYPYFFEVITVDDTHGR